MRKPSNTFKVTAEGTRTNVSTGVEIVALEFMGKRTGDYEVRVPALSRYGYTAVAVASLKAARVIALGHVLAIREQQAAAYALATR